jgi:inosine-uridine nucleoside N-ribohydrolase
MAACWALVMAPAAVGRSPHDANASAAPNVVQDTDVDFDDLAALSYLAAQDRAGLIHLRAVTVENNGVGLPGFAIAHVRCLLNRFGLGSVPVAEGPANGPHPVPLLMRLAVQALLTEMLGNCQGSAAHGPIDAATLLRRTFAQYPGAELITTGPLTNVAAAWPLSASRVVSMGGAVHVKGGLCCEDMLLYDGSQELNIFADPAAAERVIASAGSADLVMVPLDATNYVPLKPEFIARLKADHHTPEADTVLAIATNPVLDNAGSLMGGVFWWDPLAAVAALDPSVLTTEVDPLAVVQSGPSTGRTEITGNGSPVTVAITADGAAFEQRFLDGLNGQP